MKITFTIQGHFSLEEMFLGYMGHKRLIIEFYLHNSQRTHFNRNLIPSVNDFAIMPGIGHNRSAHKILPYYLLMTGMEVTDVKS